MCSNFVEKYLISQLVMAIFEALEYLRRPKYIQPIFRECNCNTPQNPTMSMLFEIHECIHYLIVGIYPIK